MQNNQRERLNEPSWRQALDSELNQPYLRDLALFLKEERASSHPIYPPSEEVFAAYQSTPFDRVRVVIVGQDPYHGAGQAHGLAFSVRRGVRPPPSLQNIFKELNRDLGVAIPDHGCLTSWASQGVLLLNAVLTVRGGSPGSHAKKGWEKFTDATLRILADQKDHIVFILWGRFAQAKGEFLVDSPRNHLVLTAPHPSPYSANSGFFGCRHFSKTNAFLQRIGSKPIDWALPVLFPKS